MFMLDREMWEYLVWKQQTLHHFPKSKKKRIIKKCLSENSAWFKKYSQLEELISYEEMAGMWRSIMFNGLQ